MVWEFNKEGFVMVHFTDKSLIIEIPTTGKMEAVERYITLSKSLNKMLAIIANNIEPEMTADVMGTVPSFLEEIVPDKENFISL